MAAGPMDHLFQAQGGTSATFLVEVGAKPVGRFTECLGLEIEIDVEPYEEGGENGFVHKLPGRMTWPDMTLKRGITWDNELLDWFNRSAGSNFAAQGKVTRENVGITMLSGTGQRLRTWTLSDAMPIKWTGPSFTNASDDMLTEELTIAHHGFRSETHAAANSHQRASQGRA